MRILRLSLVAALFASGCAVAPPDNTYAYKPGNGTVESVHQARVAIPGGTAPATALKQLAEPRWVDGYQLALRMDDGTTQAITQDSDSFHAGDRVQVTPQGRILKLPLSTANAAPATTSSTPVAVRAGGATVESVADASTVSAAGGSSVAAAPAQQLTLRMDDGTTQVLTVQ